LLEGVLSEFSNIKKTVFQYPKNLIPNYLPRRNENISSHKNLNMSVYNGCIHNHRKIKQHKCPWKDELMKILSCNGILCSSKKELTPNPWITSNAFNKQNSQTQKGYINMTPFPWHVGKGKNCKDRRLVHDYQALRREVCLLKIQGTC
jgi:hypothetical protein